MDDPANLSENQMSDLTSAYRLFLRSFHYLEESVRPVERFRVGSVDYLHWPGEGRRGGRFRYEFFGLECDPGEMVAVVDDVSQQQPFFISDVYGVRGEAAQEYAKYGYVRTYREPVMVLDLGERVDFQSDAQVIDVTTPDLAVRIVSAFSGESSYPHSIRQRQIDDPATLIKVILVDGMPACTGKGILVDDSVYITDIGTRPVYRKRGLAGVLMSSLLATARDLGATNSILTASTMAAPLYESLGYRQIGMLDIYEATPE